MTWKNTEFYFVHIFAQLNFPKFITFGGGRFLNDKKSFWFVDVHLFSFTLSAYLLDVILNWTTSTCSTYFYIPNICSDVQSAQACIVDNLSRAYIQYPYSFDIQIYWNWNFVVYILLWQNHLLIDSTTLHNTGRRSNTKST